MTLSAKKVYNGIMLKINEIFLTIQGESTYAGCPCIMVRLTGCNLRCTYCDSRYAFYEGEEWNAQDLFRKLASYRCKLICITGGEPLLQDDAFSFMESLVERQHTVLLETNGSISIKKVPGKVVKIMDIKTPGSGHEASNVYENILHLGRNDEVKFVICSKNDYLWAFEKMKEHDLEAKCTVLFSPAWGILDPEQLANWIIQDKLHARLQLQLHKYIWPRRERRI